VILWALEPNGNSDIFAKCVKSLRRKDKEKKVEAEWEKQTPETPPILSWIQNFNLDLNLSSSPPLSLLVNYI